MMVRLTGNTRGYRPMAGALLILALGLAAAPAWAQQTASGTQSTEDDWGGDDWGDDPWASEQTGWQWYGFVGGAAAARLHNDPAVDEDYPLAETRLQIEGERVVGDYTATIKGDVWLDGVEDGGRGDLREANLQGRLTDAIDIEAGRQILTWGTGDLVFLNDLFPKDYVSFFSGRNDEYLKAPSDAIKLSFYGDANLDVVYTPRGEANRFITGERLSYFSPRRGAVTAAPPAIDPDERDDWLDDSELALRLYQTVDGVEYAGYAFHGYDKQPSAVDPATGTPYFPRLSVLGASLRRPAAGGIANAETAYYFADDSGGDDPNRPNEQWRFLFGYEHEPLADLTLGWQYYLEWTQDHDALIDATPADQRRYAPDEYRHLLTNRVTWQLLRQDLTISLFSFFSPSDADYFFRPRAEYRFSDRLTGTVGGNVFGGEDPWTFHTQLQDNSNAYARIRYNF